MLPTLRVTYFDHCAKLSGGELALARLVPAIEGVEPTVILGQSGPLEEVLADLGIPTEVMPIDGGLNGMSKDRVGARAVSPATVLALLRSIFELRARLRRTRPDLLHANSLKSGVIGSIAGRLAGVPVVWHVRDRIAPDYLPRPAVHLIRLLLRFLPQAVIANSETTRATLVGVNGVAVVASPVNGADDSFEAPPARAMDVPLRIVMIGRLSPWKGQRVFLQAFTSAFAGAEVEAIIAGGPLFGEEAYERELHEFADELGISGQVSFVGHVDDVPALLASCRRRGARLYAAGAFRPGDRRGDGLRPRGGGLRRRRSSRDHHRRGERLVVPTGRRRRTRANALPPRCPSPPFGSSSARPRSSVPPTFHPNASARRSSPSIGTIAS